MSGQSPAASRITELAQSMAAFNSFFNDSLYGKLVGEVDVNDFTLGNPQEFPLPGYVDALRQQAEPQNKNWYAYKFSEPESQRTVAESLRRWRGVDFQPEDIFMTNGGWAAISVALYTLVDPGDEVIFITPPWFFYELLICQAGGTPVRVSVKAHSFDLDLEAIEAAITPRTRAIIVNSPHNPTGKIYAQETLQALAEILTRASQRNDRSIYLLSDEAYSRIVFDGNSYYSPTATYAHSLLLYTYGKTLLAPGQRIGYIALPPAMPESERQVLRHAVMVAQLAQSYAFPNALLQHALPEIEKQSIDIEHLQEKRDRLVSGLRGLGYDVHSPEGTFYLLPRAPMADDMAFIDILAKHRILALPGTVVELPGFFRLSLTASMEMIERAQPGFEAAMHEAS